MCLQTLSLSLSLSLSVSLSPSLSACSLSLSLSPLLLPVRHRRRAPAARLARLGGSLAACMPSTCRGGGASRAPAGSPAAGLSHPGCRALECLSFESDPLLWKSCPPPPGKCGASRHPAIIHCCLPFRPQCPASATTSGPLSDSGRRLENFNEMIRRPPHPNERRTHTKYIRCVTTPVT